MDVIAVGDRYYGVNDYVEGGASCGDYVILLDTPRVRELQLIAGDQGTYQACWSETGYGGTGCTVMVEGVCWELKATDFRRDYSVMWYVRSDTQMVDRTTWRVVPSVCVYRQNAEREARNMRHAGYAYVRVEGEKI